MVVLATSFWLYKPDIFPQVRQFYEMPGGLHILSFQNVLKGERDFIRSLVCRSVAKRRLILEKATPKQLRLIQKLLVLFLRGEIGVTNQLLNRIKRSKKLKFIEQNFNKIRSDPKLRQNILSLASVLHLFVKIILKKNDHRTS